MSDLWSYFKTLFQQSKVSTPSKPLVHELIIRTEAERADFLHWKETVVFKQLKSWISSQYVLFQQSPEAVDESIDFLDMPSSKGFAIYFHKTGYTTREAMHFLDFLKDQVLRMDYRVQISDLRSYERPGWVETVQRHYLKPRPAMDEKRQLRQRFGNITIELFQRDDRPHNLRFRATSYRDHLFQDAEPFHVLMNELF